MCRQRRTGGVEGEVQSAECSVLGACCLGSASAGFGLLKHQMPAEAARQNEDRRGGLTKGLREARVLSAGCLLLVFKLLAPVRH
jgi:hypothetical protein